MRQVKHYQTIEFERIQKLFTEFQKATNSTLNVLDFGCGKGKFLNLFSSLGFDVTGTDINLIYVEDAKLNGFNAISIDELFENKQKYDFIFLSHIVEHIGGVSTLWMAPKVSVKYLPFERRISKWR